jgi:multiple sugar transport system ATP-binding protein
MGNVILENIAKRFADETAVEDVNIEVEDGEFVTLVGPSGSGKSTTLEMIAGLTTPTEGQIWINDKEVTNLPPKDRGIAMVFQNIALFPHMDVYDNISFGLRLRDFPKEKIDERVENAARILQIEGLLDRMPDELSGGQRQRVAIGRAIVREPAVFLMDEPLANLDAKLRIHMRTELQRLHNQLETTIVYVTHDQAEAMTMSNRIAILDQGRLQQIAAPLTCYNEPANTFVAGFIGSPAMNLFDGELTDTGVKTDHFDLEFDTSQVSGARSGDGVTVGVRPEDVFRSDADAVPPWASRPIQTRVDVNEPMGDEIFVYLRFGDAETGTVKGEDTSDQLLMSIPPDAEVELDEDLAVVLDLSKVHLFDADTGEALIHGIADLAGHTTAAERSDADT